MKFAIFALTFCCLSLCASNPDSPAEVIDRELVAYNARDLDAFMKVFSPDCEIFEFPDKLLAKGTEAIRKRYSARFLSPNLHADVVKRIAVGDRIIDHESVTLTFPEGPGTQEFVVISEVKGGVKTRVWVMSGEKSLNKK